LPFRGSRHEAAGIGRWVAGRRDAVGTGATADERYTDFAWEIALLAMPPLLLVGCRRGDRMKGLLRIVLVVLLGLGPLAAQAPVHRIGVLGTSSEDRLRGLIVPQLAKVGLVEGRKLVLDIRTGTAAQLPMLARELIALDVNLLITSGDVATTAAKSVTKTVPIVMFSGDPIGQGLIGSLSHPGGNVTGVSLLSQTMEAKRLELLHDALPKARRIAALLDSFQLRVAALRQEISEAAANAGVEVLFFETAGPEDYGRAFSAIRAARPDALTISASPQFARDGQHLFRLSR
jgi:putative ABC transport system substrate-binding protein